jgi:hemolysin activation/secretion protein
MSAKLLGLLCGPVLALAGSATAQAQATAPSSITPQTLRPDTPDRNTSVAIPQAGTLEAPQGAGQLSVRIGKVTVEGGFAELDAQTAAIVTPLEARSVTLAEIYQAASEIEAAYARAGFVLARVAVPPQSLMDGGPLRIRVIDGYVESVDFSAVPARARRAVAARIAGLVGRRHLDLGRIEQPLLVAGEVPGLTLSSTLVRGELPGATRLVLGGRQKLISGQISAENNLSPALGTYGLTAQLSLNSALGVGEQIYGFAAGGYDVARFFTATAPVRVLGGGAVVPLGDGRFSLNPEATFSRTEPAALPGAPRTRGNLRRLTLRAGYTAHRTRHHALVLNATAEQIDETNALPEFGTDISHDRFMAARLGANYSRTEARGGTLYLSGQLSQGLGDLGAIRPARLPLGTTLSRQGASLSFTRIDLSLRAFLPLPRGWQLSLGARAQTSFGKPLLRSEQTALEGSEAVSAYLGGNTAVDEAITLRAEFGRPVSIAHLWAVAPYLFAAGGVGLANRPTVLEPGGLSAGSVGAGLRAAVAGTGLTFAAEYAHGFSDYAPLRSANRLNAAITLRV